MSGPLDGIKVIELAGIGPAPYACMLLADAGADIIRFDRIGAGPTAATPSTDFLARSRASVGIDLKRPEAVELILGLCEQADVLIEGFRPGVAERLGVGPEPCQAHNAKLVYGRMTGWGQDGPLAPTAGHDIDYIAIAGSLWPMGRRGERPVPPLNLVGDFGGGGMMLAFGISAALIEAARSGQGQVVDAAMVDGAASLCTMLFSMHQSGVWEEARGVNLLDTGAPFYEVYETADGRYLAVGAIEPQFYAALVKGLDLEAEELADQNDRAQWPAMKERFAAVIATRTRDEWVERFEGTDACVAPVLSPYEAHRHPHNAARATFVEVDGAIQPGPAPRFSRTPSRISRPPARPGADTDAALGAWGVGASERRALREVGAVG